MFKVRNLILGLAMVSTVQAIGAPASRPIISQNSHSGYTPEEWSFSESCNVYADRVEIIKTFGLGALVSKEVRKLEVGGSDGLANIAKKAAEEATETEENGRCDGPSTVIQGSIVLPRNRIQDFTIYSTGGCGQPKETRVGPYSYMLSDLVHGFCRKFY